MKVVQKALLQSFPYYFYTAIINHLPKNPKTCLDFIWSLCTGLTVYDEFLKIPKISNTHNFAVINIKQKGFTLNYNPKRYRRNRKCVDPKPSTQRAVRSGSILFPEVIKLF